MNECKHIKYLKFIFDLITCIIFNIDVKFKKINEKNYSQQPKPLPNHLSATPNS